MRRPGTKPVGAVLAAALIGSLAVAAAAYGRPAATTAPTGADRAQAADAALLRAGIARGSGFSRRSPGQVASLGGQQLGWARYFVTRWNRFHKLQDHASSQGDTQLPDTAQRPSGRRSRSPGTRRCSPTVGPAGSQEVVVSSPPLQVQRRGLRLGLRDADDPDARRFAAGSSSASSRRTRSRARASPNYIYNTLRARNVVHHRRPGGVRVGPLGRGAAAAAGRAAQPSRGTRSTSGRRRTSRRSSRRSAAASTSSTSRGSSRARRRCSASSCVRRASRRRCSGRTACSTRTTSRSPGRTSRSSPSLGRRAVITAYRRVTRR